MSSNDESSCLAWISDCTRLRKNQPTSTTTKAKRAIRARRLVNSTTGRGDLQQSQGVFEDLTKLANLGGAHGALFAWGAEIIVDAFLQVPLEQLHTFVHAHLLGAASPRLVQLVELDDLSHAAARIGE